MKVAKYFSNGFASLALGLGCRTVLFVCLLYPFFHSYDCDKDEYRYFFQFGNYVTSVNSVVVALWIVPAFFLIAGLISAWRSPKPRQFSIWAWVGIVAFGVGAELALWLVLFWLAFAGHFTTGDVFKPGVC